MKKKILIIGSIVLLIALLGGLFFVFRKSDDNKVTNPDAIKFKEEYESMNGEVNESNNKKYRSVTISKDNPFVYKTAEELATMIENNETFIVYFGFKSCPWCRSVISTLDEVAKEENVDKIYYVDVLDIRDTLTLDSKNKVVVSKEGSTGYKKLIELLSDVLDKYTLTTDKGKTIDTKEKRIYAPNVISVVDGKATLKVEGISEEQTDAYMDLTDEMLEFTKAEFKKVITSINNENCTDKTFC